MEDMKGGGGSREVQAGYFFFIILTTLSSEYNKTTNLSVNACMFFLSYAEAFFVFIDIFPPFLIFPLESKIKKKLIKKEQKSLKIKKKKRNTLFCIGIILIKLKIKGNNLLSSTFGTLENLSTRSFILMRYSWEDNKFKNN